MFVCKECGNLFHEPEHFVESHNLDTPPYEEWYGCPSCSGPYAQAYQCDCCGEYIIYDYIKLTNGDRICGECYVPMELGEED